MTPPAPHILDNIQYANCFFWGCILGLCVFIFGRPIQKPKKVSQGTWRKSKGRKPKQKRTARKNRVVQKPKQNQEPVKPWAKMPPSTPERDQRIERMFRVGRGEVVDNSWG